MSGGERLARFLRQVRELGGEELYLDSLDRREAIALARAFGTRRPVSAGAAVRAVVGGLPAGPAPAGADPERVQAMAQLGAEVAGCTRCRLASGRRNVVFGRGSAAAELAVVGEAPGFEEDRTGLPFVGPAGRLLDLLLLSVGFGRDDVYICNVLKCRPPENRNPLPDEVAACSPYLRAQIERIAPKAILAVGKFAAQTLIGTEESIGKLRGRVFAYEGVPLMATYHPAFLLRSRQWVRATWEDFQLVRQVLDEQS
jgi:DNA polymerase